MQVVLDKVSKRFGDVEVVSRLDLMSHDGEFLVLLGPSGCGKTTVLRMIAGLETVTEGAIRIGERDVTQVLPKHRDVAMVFQSYALYPHMTVAQNIGYPLRLRRVARPERDEAVAAVAHKVQLDALLERYPRQLSGGQRQRVALARAMVRRPGLFLMDEPLSNLDAKLRGQMRSQLKHLQSELGTTTVYVTHDQIEAMTLGDRVAVMESGVIQQLDTPRAVYNDPANRFVAGFMGSPPMNFVPGAIADGIFRAPGCELPCPGFADHAQVELGVRAEDARVVTSGNSGEAVAEGRLRGSIYAVELTGDETLVTVATEQTSMVVRMDKDFEADLDTPVEIALDSGRTYFFDVATGARLRTRG